MNKLDSLVCVPCQIGTPTLKKSQVLRYLKKADSWNLEENPEKITRIFEFKDFGDSIKFVRKIADLAESEGHHPNIYIHSYNKVKIELWTHKIGGLHKNDFIMAAKIDNIS